jgi:hypothetical protein
MRLEKEAPQTQFEIEVENILIENGYNKEDIQFREVVFKSDVRYLRVGYWKYLSDKALDQLKPYIKEVVDMYDDDCGTLWYYELNQ